MGVISLGGIRATSARLSIPAWGCWYAEVSLDGEHALTGSVTLAFADLTLRGTVLSGGPYKGRSYFRIVAGAGGWGKILPAKSYNSDAEVKASTVLLDAANAVGENVGSATTLRTGPAYVRDEGPAVRVLEVLFPRGWYVDEAGITRLGARARAEYASKATVSLVDKARGKVQLATDSVATLLPGIVVEGIEAVDVLHEATKDGIRTTLWGKRTGASRRLEAMRKIFDQLDPDRAYRAVYEYRVVTLAGDRVNLQPVRASTGMPDLRRVPMRPGVSGAYSDVALGSRVLVAFVDADAGRPVVVAFEDSEGSGFVPTLTEIDATVIKIGQGALPAARMGDLAGGIWPVNTTQTKTLV